MKLSIIALLLSLATACGSSQVEKDLEPTQQDKGPPNYSFGAEFPFVMAFNQGVEKSYDLLDHVKVPSSSPVLSVENLPEGATFDGKMLTWTPSCDMPVESFGDGHTIHYIRFTLKSAADDEQYVQRSAALLILQHQSSTGRKCGEKANTSIGSPSR